MSSPYLHLSQVCCVCARLLALRVRVGVRASIMCVACMCYARMQESADDVFTVPASLAGVMCVCAYCRC